jgi:tetratricopeptide (TPR) repeat protein
VKGDYAAAEAEFRTVVGLYPDGIAYTNLGNALTHQDKLDEAIEAYRTAIQLHPEYDKSHCALGETLRKKGEFDEAAAEYREAIRCNPEFAPHYSDLATALYQQGKLDEAIDADRTAVRLNPRRALGYYKLGGRLDAKQKLDEAAAAAALAGSGKASDDPPPDEAARRRFRIKAHDWLRADLERCTKLLSSDDAKEHVAVAQQLDHWREDPDLAGIREVNTLAKLPEAELKKWQTLWNDVDSLRKRVKASQPTAGKRIGPGKDLHSKVSTDAKPPSVRQETGPPAIPKSDFAPEKPDGFASIHKRAHELAPSKPGEAEPLFRHALEGYRKTQGPNGAMTLDLTLDLANLAHQSCRAIEAEPLFREAMEQFRERFGSDDPGTAGIMAVLATTLIQQDKYTDAEPILRECLATREKHQPDEWTTFNTHSLLGGCLLGQKKYPEAEPLIISGYEGTKSRENTIPPPGKPRLVEASERVVKLYDAWGKSELAAQWRAKLAMPSKVHRRKP